MAIRAVKPTSPARRYLTYVTYDEITKTEPEKGLLTPKRRTNGRNAGGRITVRHRGGGAKRMLRDVDFRREKLGIPARVAMGLLYVDEFAGESGIFGWHMWTQALIDGQWVDFDATLPVRTNAGHVLTNVSALSDGLGMTDMASIMQLLGNVDIEVIEVGYD